MLLLSKIMNGVIWSKTQQTFVPISSIPIYAKMQQERFKQSRALESHNFQLQNLTLTSFEEPYFFEFYDNDTRISGLYGEIWNLLSELLNFTLQPVRANVDSLGILENSTYKHGLLSIISRNETIAIPKLEMDTKRLAACDFTIPFWINRLYLYIRPEIIHDNTWMVQIFSWKIWVTILMMHILLSICTFLTQNILVRTCGTKYPVNRPFSEHLFYSYRNLCGQNIIPEDFNGRSRILELFSNLFSVIMSIAFGALLFTYITKRVFVPPFDGFDSLAINTNYKIVTLTGSIGDIIFKVSSAPSLARIRTSKRLAVIPTIEEMHKLACNSRKGKYAIYQGEEEYKVRKHIICYLTPAGRSYPNIWMGSGIVKNFKYKRTVDIGIIKLMEVGMLDALNHRSLQRKIKPTFNDNEPQPIEIQQVSLIITLACCGVIITLIIFIIENIVFVYKIKRS